MPADAMMDDALATTTNAITIGAPTVAVWPWLAQLGSGRAGWYSYDRVDNGGRPSARRIVPEYQQVAPGDLLPALPGSSQAFVVASVTPASHLVLTVPDGSGGSHLSWEYLLQPTGSGGTRLVMRGRLSGRWLESHRALARIPRPILLAAARLGHRIMLARHLRGIKRRAEGRLAQPALAAGRAWTPETRLVWK
jgi:hypothetical protein